MTDMPLLGSDKTDWAAQHVLGQYDAPAFVRRARQTDGALTQLVTQCRHRREEWLEMVALRLGVLRGLAGEWKNLSLLLADPAHVELLERLHVELQPQLRAPVEATSSLRRLRNALEELRQSILRFNRRWTAFLGTVDLKPINELIDGYNRFYVLEKECVVRSATIARQGFRPKEHFSHEQLRNLLPPLPILQLKP
jgi:hypothetical protein